VVQKPGGASAVDFSSGIGRVRQVTSFTLAISSLSWMICGKCNTFLPESSEHVAGVRTVELEYWYVR